MKTPKEKQRELEKAQLRKEIKKIIGKCRDIYCVLRHVSQSGMMRHIDFYIFKNNRPIWLTSRIGQLLDYRQAPSGSLKVGGCGMDMGFAVVYDLSSELYCNKKYNHDKAYRLNSNWL